MIIFISGGTHTGKTCLAQKLLEQYHYPYLSIDHLKMGLIRSGYCDLTPESSDEALTSFLWPVVAEMVKTAIENEQNLIVEGCYIPFDYEKDFTDQYLKNIKFICLIFSKEYIETHFDEIVAKGNMIERRLSYDINKKDLIKENEQNLALCQKYGCEYILMDKQYDVDFQL